MSDRVWRPARDRLIAAELAGHASYRAPWREPDEAEIEQAAAELAEIAGGRDDLLVERAGILIGFYGDDPPEVRARAHAAATFLLAATAGPVPEGDLLDWIEEGGRRRERADQPPFGMRVTPQALAD